MLARRFGEFRLDLANQRLWHLDKLLPLTPKSFAVLTYLSERSQRLVTKAELFRELWPGINVSDAALTVCIHEIRRALNDNFRVPCVIETMHKRGYRFLPDVVSRPEPICFEDKSYGGEVDNHQATTSTVTAPATLIGRQAELTDLQEALSKATLGNRQVVFIEGETGIGKTALLQQFVNRFCGGPASFIAVGDCHRQHGEGEAYLPIFEALGRLASGPEGSYLIPIIRRYAPGWLMRMPALASPIELLNLRQHIHVTDGMLREMADAFEAITSERLMILCLENLHWSDYATLDLIANLAHSRRAGRLLLICTSRPAEVIARGHPVRSLKRELQVQGCCNELQLEGLQPESIKDYLAAWFPVSRIPVCVARALYDQTEGNPLFLNHFIRDWIMRNVLREVEGLWILAGDIEDAAKTIPEFLHDMLEGRIEALRDEEQAVLEAASIAGIEFSTVAVAAGLDADIETAEKRCEDLARRVQFIRRKLPRTDERRCGEVARYCFFHALERAVLERRIPPARRRQLELRVEACKQAQPPQSSKNDRAILKEWRLDSG
jgi:predicted ATPase/DNA-binding winged helix-turn-helix (wHTH) protein